MFNKFVFSFCLIWLAGCAGLDTRPEQFKVNISSVQMLESTLMEQRFEVKLRIMNRSREAISVDGMSFDIELNGKDFASGVSNNKVIVEPFSEGIVSVSVVSTIFGIMRQINSLHKNKAKPFQYKISGHLYTDSSLFGVPFNESGEIDLKPSTGTMTENEIL